MSNRNPPRCTQELCPVSLQRPRRKPSPRQCRGFAARTVASTHLEPGPRNRIRHGYGGAPTPPHAMPAHSSLARCFRLLAAVRKAAVGFGGFSSKSNTLWLSRAVKTIRSFRATISSATRSAVRITKLVRRGYRVKSIDPEEPQSDFSPHADFALRISWPNTFELADNEAGQILN